MVARNLFIDDSTDVQLKVLIHAKSMKTIVK